MRSFRREGDRSGSFDTDSDTDSEWVHNATALCLTPTAGLRKFSGMIRVWAVMLVVITGSVFCGPLAEGRIGETKQQFEERVLNNRTMIRYPDDVVERKIAHRDVPYRQLYEFMPASIEHRVYFKRAEAEPASQSDLRDEEYPPGWDLHVIYHQGRIVVEGYRRNGARLSEPEFNGLLHLNRGDSFWVSSGKAAARPSAVNYRFITEDGATRAARSGNTALFIDSSLDEAIHTHREYANEERKREQERSAPRSLAGF